jgi:Mrp family chromosome partitioning ATPase
MRFLRGKKSDPEGTFPLSLTGADGESWLEFPGPVVDSIRQSINRIMRTEPFPEKLVMTSAVRQEGVTYLSKAIGTVLANDFARKCCVLELNWWWPADYPQSIVGRPGLAEVLEDKATLEEALIPTAMSNLSLLSAGRLANKLRPTFAGSEALSTLIDSLARQFDYLILDTPAVTATSDSILLAGYGTALGLVIRQGATPVQRVRAALDDLDHLNIIGVIMNQVNVATPGFLLDYIAQE